MIAYHESPSNIAFIKYWGKSGLQTPMNPSLSMTLEKCLTKMEIEVSLGEEEGLEVFLDNTRAVHFDKKIQVFFNNVKNEFSFLQQKHFITVRSSNSFPHSSGIASSASAFSALAQCCSQIESQYCAKDYSLNEISSAARLGSGSACRSIEHGFFHWGRESELFATRLTDAHPIFNTLYDSILIVDSKKKNTASSLGHELMNNHPLKDARIKMANDNFTKMLKAMSEGDIKAWGEIVENEALTLHALMFSSIPSVILLKPNSLEIIQNIKDFRDATNSDMYFTIDAGANIHLLYFEKDYKRAQDFIEENLKQFCENGLIIHDRFGGRNV